MGSRIRKYFTENGQTYTTGCTAGYKGVGASGQDVLVTVGHCDDIGSTAAWYQADNNSVGIGNWAFRTTSSAADGSDKTSDAGYINLTGKTGTPWVPNPTTSGSATPITGVYTSDLENDTVYMRGATSGVIRTGTIRYANVDVWYGVAGYGYVRNLVFAVLPFLSSFYAHLNSSTANFGFEPKTTSN